MNPLAGRGSVQVFPRAPLLRGSGQVRVPPRAPFRHSPLRALQSLRRADPLAGLGRVQGFPCFLAPALHLQCWSQGPRTPVRCPAGLNQLARRTLEQGLDTHWHSRRKSRCL